MGIYFTFYQSFRYHRNMKQLFVFVYLLLLPYLTVNEESYTIVPIDVELNSTAKPGLRYGFQQTSECLNFQKAFLCVRKCLDLNFDIAYADKHCICKCYYNKQKAKYTIKYNTTKTNWKLGAPTTSIPPWAQEKMKTKKKHPKTEATEPNNIVDMNDDDSANESDHSNSTDIVPASNETVTRLTIGGTSIGPLANGTESSVANGTATIADTGSGIVNGTTVAGSKSGGVNSTATVAGNEAGAGSGSANSTATVAGTVAGDGSGSANSTATVAGTAAGGGSSGANGTATVAGTAGGGGSGGANGTATVHDAAGKNNETTTPAAKAT